MAEVNTKIIYDRREDILNLSRGIPSKASIEIGDFIIDIDNKGFVSGIEILNASENLKMNEDLLEKFDKASMSVIYKPGYICVYINFYFQDKEKEIAIPLSINLGHQKIEKEQMVFAK